MSVYRRNKKWKAMGGRDVNEDKCMLDNKS